jgi:hypothetical protein
MDGSFRYADPLVVEKPEDCRFYHRMNLPGVGVVGGDWDLEPTIDDYLGRVNFQGKRALDVGAASGCLSFAMEQRGADVVSFDMAEGLQWDIVPQVAIQKRLARIRAGRDQAHRQLKNAYWYAHRRLQSRARVYYGNVYDLPAELGRFDVAMFGMILSHLRDPFQALYSVSRLVSETIIITNQLTSRKGLLGLFIKAPWAVFCPATSPQEFDTWWSFSKECLAGMLRVLGFQVERAIHTSAQCLTPQRRQHESCTALVARRVAGSVAVPTGGQKGVAA